MIMQDDIMDRSETRRGIPCWYKVQNVGLKAINDSVLVENGIYSLMKKHFSQHKSYVPILELFHKTFTKTSYGQVLDMESAFDGPRSLENFTMNTYISIALNKCAFYTYILPVTLAMHFAEKYDDKLYQDIIPVLNDLGLLIQIQDDFLDAFGNPQLVGKMGTDIRTGKCSWLAVTAIQLATPNQRKLFEQCYGSPKEECQAEILNLYHQLDLPNLYSIREAALHDRIHSGINKISDEQFPRAIMLKLLGGQIFHFAAVVEDALSLYKMQH